MNTLCRVFSAAAPLQQNPGPQSHIGKRDSQMLHGESFRVSARQDDWAYGVSILDGYTGWVEICHLSTTNATPTHAISCLSANAYSSPDAKTRPVDDATLSFMARVAVVPGTERNGFVMIEDSCLWIPKNALIALDDLTANPADIVETAMMFSGVPYLYSARGAGGIDCSGLVQLSLQRNNVACPRDCDQQEGAVGRSVTHTDIRRADIVYFPGHVAIMTDGQNAVNANMRHMAVVVENLDDLIRTYGPPTSVRRLEP